MKVDQYWEQVISILDKIHYAGIEIKFDYVTDGFEVWENGTLCDFGLEFEQVKKHPRILHWLNVLKELEERDC